MTCRWHVRAAERLFRRKANPSLQKEALSIPWSIFKMAISGLHRKSTIVVKSLVDHIVMNSDNMEIYFKCGARIVQKYEK